MYDILISFVNDILSSENPCIIVGDFNLPDICWSSLMGKSPISSSFCDFVFRCNLTQHVQDPTHMKGNILDLVLSNPIDELVISSPRNYKIDTDHFLISFCPTIAYISSSCPKICSIMCLIMLELIRMVYAHTSLMLISIHVCVLIRLERTKTTYSYGHA